MIDPTILLIFAVLGFWFSLAFLASLLVGVIRRHRRRKRTVEVFAALCDAMDRTDAMGRHPAGGQAGKWAVASRTTCGHLIFGADPGDLIANEIQHVQHCPHSTGEKAA